MPWRRGRELKTRRCRPSRRGRTRTDSGQGLATERVALLDVAPRLGITRDRKPADWRVTGMGSASPHPLAAVLAHIRWMFVCESSAARRSSGPTRRRSESGNPTRPTIWRYLRREGRPDLGGRASRSGLVRIGGTTTGLRGKGGLTAGPRNYTTRVTAWGSCLARLVQHPGLLLRL